MLVTQETTLHICSLLRNIQILMIYEIVIKQNEICKLKRKVGGNSSAKLGKDDDSRGPMIINREPSPKNSMGPFRWALPLNVSTRNNKWMTKRIAVVSSIARGRGGEGREGNGVQMCEMRVSDQDAVCAILAWKHSSHEMCNLFSCFPFLPQISNFSILQLIL